MRIATDPTAPRPRQRPGKFPQPRPGSKEYLYSQVIADISRDPSRPQNMGPRWWWNKPPQEVARIRAEAQDYFNKNKNQFPNAKQIEQVFAKTTPKTKPESPSTPPNPSQSFLPTGPSEPSAPNTPAPPPTRPGSGTDFTGSQKPPESPSTPIQTNTFNNRDPVTGLLWHERPGRNATDAEWTRYFKSPTGQKALQEGWFSNDKDYPVFRKKADLYVEKFGTDFTGSAKPPTTTPSAPIIVDSHMAKPKDIVGRPGSRPPVIPMPSPDGSHLGQDGWNTPRPIMGQTRPPMKPGHGIDHHGNLRPGFEMGPNGRPRPIDYSMVPYNQRPLHAIPQNLQSFYQNSPNSIHYRPPVRERISHPLRPDAIQRPYSYQNSDGSYIVDDGKTQQVFQRDKVTGGIDYDSGGETRLVYAQPPQKFSTSKGPANAGGSQSKPFTKKDLYAPKHPNDMVYMAGANYKDDPMYSTHEIERRQQFERSKMQNAEAMGLKKYEFQNQKQKAQFVAEGGTWDTKSKASGKHPFERLTSQEYGALSLAAQAGDRDAKLELDRRYQSGQRYIMDSASAQALLKQGEQKREKEKAMAGMQDPNPAASWMVQDGRYLGSNEKYQPNQKPVPKPSNQLTPYALSLYNELKAKSEHPSQPTPQPAKGKVRGTGGKTRGGGPTLPNSLDKLAAINNKKSGKPSITIGRKEPGVIGSTTLTPDSIKSQMSYGGDGNMQVSASPVTAFYKGKPIHQSPSKNGASETGGPKPTFRKVGGRVIAIRGGNKAPSTTAKTEVRNGKLYSDFGGIVGGRMGMVYAPKTQTKPSKGMR